jgi:hypothetical protein
MTEGYFYEGRTHDRQRRELTSANEAMGIAFVIGNADIAQPGARAGNARARPQRRYYLLDSPQ